MNRLTYKIEKNYQTHYDIKEKYVDKSNSFSIWVDSCKALNKLGQLEDIEEELGMSLETYVRLHQDGFYGVCKDDNDKPYIFQFDNRCFDIFTDDKTIVVYYEDSDEEYKTYRIKDYGKTWALTKEELLIEVLNG